MKMDRIMIRMVVLAILIPMQVQGFILGINSPFLRGGSEEINTLTLDSTDQIDFTNDDSKNNDLNRLSASISTTLDYINHEPISIFNDSAFGPSGYNFPGDGTANDPYLISGYNITSSSGPLIQIINTTKYFQIGNNTLKLTHNRTFYKGNEYKIIRSATTWVSAKAACEALGGHLVTISDIGENHFVADLAKDEVYFWIGLSDSESEGTWKWVTGESLSYTNWLSPNPNDYGAGQDYVLMYGGEHGAYSDYVSATGGWNDMENTTNRYYICEWEANSIYDSIYLNNVSNGDIVNNSLLNANIGVQIENTQNLSISHNEFSNHSSYAIFTDQSNFSNICGNIISDCYIGIFSDSSKSNNLSKNIISDCMVGISFISSNNSLIIRNTFSDCIKATIDLQSSTENAIQWNNFFLGHKAVIFNEHKYLLVKEKNNWTIAKTASEALGGHLVTINSQAERDFIYEILTENGNIEVWIGLTDDDIYGGQEDTGNTGTAPYWVWVTGEPFVYEDWASGLPNNGGSSPLNYVYMNPDLSGGTWNDLWNGAYDGEGWFYICEWDSIEYVIDTGGGNNTYQYNYWDGFDGSDNNSDGNVDIPYRVTNNGLYFDGANDYADLTDFAVNENFTIELWVNPFDTNDIGGKCIIGKHTSTDGNLLLLFLNNSALYYIDDTGWYYLGEIYSGWQHLTLIIERNTTHTRYQCFKNGILLKNETRVGIVADYDGKAWTIGQDWDSGSSTTNFFYGIIDEIRILNGALTPVEIFEDCSSPTTHYPTRVNTVAWYHLNETSGTLITDYSSNGYNGITKNGATWGDEVVALDLYPRITPIWIDSNDDFKNFSSSGDGKSATPYIIENYFFISNQANLIEIYNTTAYFVIQNSILDGLEGSNSAIYFKNVTNGGIMNNKVLNGYYGIHLSSSDNNTITMNTISNGTVGINISLSVSNHIKCNLVCNNTRYGIELDTNSENNTVEWNLFLNNNQTGHQAYDEGVTNVFQYNYWNDWISPDVGTDGFVDIPYDIDGGNTQDLYPVTTIVPLVKILSPLVQTYGIDTFLVNLSGNAFLFIYYIEGADGSNQTWSSISNRTLDEGSYTLHVYGSDPLGKYTIYESVSFTIDTILPSIDISSPLSTIHRQKNIVLVYSISDSTAIHTTIYINDVANTTAISSGSTSTFPDGDYNITIIVVDQAGHIGIAAVLFTVDTVPPTVIIASPTTTTYPTGSISISLSGDSEAYWYYIAGIDSANHTWTSAVSRSLADGTYTLHAYGNDSAGNEAHTSATFTIGTATTSTTQETRSTTETTTTTTSKKGSFTEIITLLFYITTIVIVIRKRKKG